DGDRMGELIWCAQEDAKQPFTIQPMNFPIYSMEELVFYIEQNFYALDKSLINQNLARWIREELHMTELADNLASSIRTQQSAYALALMILKSSGMYSSQELAKLKSRFSNMDGKTVIECRKMKADQYLADGKYISAVNEYKQVLTAENMSKMTDELRAGLYHNQGVAYARMFLFPEACDCFWKAYQQNQSPESREAYLYALNYTQDGEVEDKSAEMNLDFDTMREVFGKFQNASSDNGYLEERLKVQEAMRASREMSLAERRELLDAWKQAYLESCMP
ncbi:MAG: hypothetical protein IJ471_09785, partial [Eubacterium sp.]|nr:hypothetical protein [Eubacterium sp.]